MMHHAIEITQRVIRKEDIYKEHEDKEFKISCSRCGAFFGEQATLSEAVAFAKGLVYPFGAIIPGGDGTILAISVKLNISDTEFDQFNSSHVACMQAFSEGDDNPAKEFCP